MGYSNISHPTSFHNFLTSTKIDIKNEDSKQCVPDKTVKSRPLSSVLFFTCNTKLQTLVLSPPSLLLPPLYDNVRYSSLIFLNIFQALLKTVYVVFINSFTFFYSFKGFLKYKRLLKFNIHTDHTLMSVFKNAVKTMLSTIVLCVTLLEFHGSLHERSYKFSKEHLEYFLLGTMPL